MLTTHTLCTHKSKTTILKTYSRGRTW